MFDKGGGPTRESEGPKASSLSARSFPLFASELPPEPCPGTRAGDHAARKWVPWAAPQSKGALAGTTEEHGPALSVTGQSLSLPEPVSS